MAQQIFAQFYLTNLVYSLDRTLLASVMINSDAKLRSRCHSSPTGYDNCPDSRRCVVRIPRRVIFFSILSFCVSYAACPLWLTYDANRHHQIFHFSNKISSKYDSNKCQKNCFEKEVNYF